MSLAQHIYFPWPSEVAMTYGSVDHAEVPPSRVVFGDL